MAEQPNTEVTPESTGEWHQQNENKFMDEMAAIMNQRTEHAQIVEPPKTMDVPAVQPSNNQSNVDPVQPESDDKQEPQPKLKASSVVDKLKGITDKPDAEDQQPKVEEIPEYKKGTTSDQWKEVHRLKNEAIARAQAAEIALQKAKADAANSYEEKILQIQDEAKQYKSQLDRIAIERSPEFNREFQGKVDGILSNIRTLVGADIDTVKNILNAPPSPERMSKLQDVMDGLPELNKAVFAANVIEHDKVLLEKQQRIEQSIKNWESDQQKAASDKELQIAEVNSKFDKVFADYKTEYANTEDPVFNNKVEEAIVKAKTVLNSNDLTPETMADQAVKAQMFDPLSNLIVRLHDQIVEVQTENEKLRGSSPDPSSSSASSSDNSESDNVFNHVRETGDMRALVDQMVKQGIPLGPQK